MLYTTSTIVQMLVEPEVQNVQISVSANADSEETKWDRVQQKQIDLTDQNLKMAKYLSKIWRCCKTPIEAKWDMEVDKDDTIVVVDRYLQVEPPDHYQDH